MIGGGYVGLVSGACFAEFGIDVTVVEADPKKLAMLHEGRMPIYEPGLDKLVAENVAAGRLAFTGELAQAVHGAEAVFLAVGTPTRRGDGHADLRYVYAAAEQVARAMTGYAVIVTKSTVPVGTGRRIAEIVRAACPDLEFDVASNPEFLPFAGGLVVAAALSTTLVPRVGPRIPMSVGLLIGAGGLGMADTDRRGHVVLDPRAPARTAHELRTLLARSPH